MGCPAEDGMGRGAGRLAIGGLGLGVPEDPLALEGSAAGVADAADPDAEEGAVADGTGEEGARWGMGILD